MRILFVLYLLPSINVFAQNGYKKNDIVKETYIKKIINYTSATTSLNNLKGKLTIIDFFGTWCNPCIKALPALKAFKEQFKNDLNIILISSETEAQLNTFITTRKPFAFPIIVDEDEVFTNAFMPPAYPYTVILDKNLKVLSLTNTTELTDDIIKNFLLAQNENKEVINIEITDKKDTIKKISINKMNDNTVQNKLLQFSQDFIYAAKTNTNVENYILKLKTYNYDTLIANLKTDDERKTFWINLYNAYTNTALHKNPDQYKNRSTFFKTKNIVVAGKVFSLDKIEHDILRRSKIKWSLGYLNKWFPKKVDRQLRVKKLDYRIHFALNCGAKSCPPIAFYAASTINKQLDIATKTFLTSEVQYNKENNTVTMPILLSWFRRDFGGKKNIIILAQKLALIPNNSTPKILFKKYDWTLYLENYKN